MNTGTVNGTVSEGSTTSMLTALIGEENTLKILDMFHGERLYIPNRIRDGRDENIRRDFRDLLGGGATRMHAYDNLSKKYNISVTRVRAILKE